MKRCLGILALSLVWLAAPDVAEAGRPRGGTVMTPYGPLYNTNSPEWKAAGGNIYLYEEIMQEKMMMKQYQAMMKYQQQMAKQLKNKPQLKNQQPQVNFMAQPVRSKKKRRTLQSTSSSTASSTSSSTSTSSKSSSKTPKTSSKNQASTKTSTTTSK